MLFSSYVDIVIALVLGACLGTERSYSGKTAGMRTYSLVSMGACLFIIISRSVIPEVTSFNFDPLRVAAAIIMGIGFLCGGVIIFKDSEVSGLTTAAGLWVSAGIGMAVGFGFEALAIFATISTLIVFTFFWSIEHVVFKMRDKHRKS